MKYNPKLDGLRCLAVFFVLISHSALSKVVDLHLGTFGVTLFFVISGFLITSILQNTNDSFSFAYKQFVGRRTLRIFPIYYLTVAVLAVATMGEIKAYFPYLLSYTYNYGSLYNPAVGGKYIGPAWSLSVEEQFYLIWPLIVLPFRKNTGVIKWISVAVLFFCAVQMIFYVIPGPPMMNFFATFPRCYSLLIGAMGAYLYKEGRLNRLHNKGLEIACILMFALLIYLNNILSWLMFPVLSLFIIIKTFQGFSLRPLNTFLQNKTVVYLGSISYGIYLFHYPLLEGVTLNVVPWLWEHLPFDKMGFLGKIKYHRYLVEVVEQILYFGLPLLVAHLSYQKIEKPILTLKDKWFPYKKREIRRPFLMA